MTVSLSKELLDYAEALKDWSIKHCRPHARTVDRSHALPTNWREIIATAPLLPDSLPDGEWVTKLVSYEAIAYGDMWALYALNNGIGQLVVKALGRPEQVKRWNDPVEQNGWVTGFALTEPGFGA